MTETPIDYLGFQRQPPTTEAQRRVQLRQVTRLAERLDKALARGSIWRNRWHKLMIRFRADRNKWRGLADHFTVETQEWCDLAGRFAERSTRLATLNRALAADLEQCERENANLQTLSLLDADRAISRLTEIAALTDANGILQNQVTGLDAETETQEDMIHDLEARLSLCEGRCPQQEPPHLEPPEGVSARQCPSCGMWFWSDVGATTHCLSCQRAMACDEQNEDEDKQSPDPMADLLRLGNMVYLP